MVGRHPEPFVRVGLMRGARGQKSIAWITLWEVCMNLPFSLLQPACPSSAAQLLTLTRLDCLPCLARPQPTSRQYAGLHPRDASETTDPARLRTFNKAGDLLGP